LEAKGGAKGKPAAIALRVQVAQKAMSSSPTDNAAPTTERQERMSSAVDTATAAPTTERQERKSSVVEAALADAKEKPPSNRPETLALGLESSKQLVAYAAESEKRQHEEVALRQLSSTVTMEAVDAAVGGPNSRGAATDVEVSGCAGGVDGQEGRSHGSAPVGDVQRI